MDGQNHFQLSSRWLPLTRNDMTRRWKIQQVVGKNSQSAQNFCGWWLVWKTEIFGIRSCSWTRSSQPSPPAAWQLLRSHQSNIGPAASLPKSQHKDLNFYDKFKTHHLDLLNLSFDANWCRCRRAVAAQAVFFMCLFSEKNINPKQDTRFSEMFVRWSVWSSEL